MAPLTVLTSINRVENLQAFSVSETCLDFALVYSDVILRPQLGYVPKDPTASFRDQVMNLQALSWDKAYPYPTHSRSVASPHR